MHSRKSQSSLSKGLALKTLKCGETLPDIKEQIRNYFLKTYNIYEKLFTVIKNQSSYYVKPEPLRHPLIFYFGHTAALFVNKFFDKGLIHQRINQSYERMFAVGVDEMDWDDLSESHYQWPCLADAKKFRQSVKKMVLNVIDQCQQTDISWNNNLWLVLMGIQHERIHLETSAVIIRRLPIQQVQQPEWFKQCPHSIKQLSKIPVNLLKKINQFQKHWDRQKQTAQTYGWDNEFGHKHIQTKQHKASHMLVSNGEYFEFFESNGYAKGQFWSQEGKNWLKSTRISKPVFWQIKHENAEDEPSFYLRTMTKVIQMPWDWPVQVNNLEAQAFCAWKGEKINKKLRLPTEDEYYAMRSLLKQDLNDWKQGQVGNINLENWLSPSPVNMFENKGFFDIVGNVWQHTATPLYPFEGFEIHPIYEDFSTPTFDNRHNIIKGGSFISTGNEALYHARYAFRRHFYQFAGFRYVQSENLLQEKSADVDQSDQSVEMALKSHFMDQQSYIQEVLTFVEEKVNKKNVKKSLVAGCSVGRLPLQFSRHFENSYGIDYTARYFQMATRLLEQKCLKYRSVEIQLQKFKINEQNYKKVILNQMNPENIDSKKVNQIDFMIIDGVSIRKNTLSKALRNCLNLCSKQKGIQIMIISNQQKNYLSKSDQDFLAQHFKLVAEKNITSKGSQSVAQETKLSLYSGRLNL